MTTRIIRPAYLIDELGELGVMPDGGIINAGGTTGPYFTVGGKPLLFADGTSTAPTPGFGTNLQTVYGNSLTGNIDLSAGKDFVFTALNGQTVTIDAATGRLTITGDLTVLGSSVVIEGVVQNTDQLNIGMPNATTVGVKVAPNIGIVPTVNLFEVSKLFNTAPSFYIDSDGATHLTTLYTTGLINGVDLAALDSDVTNHLNAFTTPAKHTAEQISVSPLLSNFAGNNVQQVLESINLAFATNVTSVAVSSPDLTVTGSPITSSGTIGLSLNTVPISKGGTGEITAAAAINALVPVQLGQTGKVLGTDGAVVGWVTAGSSVVGSLFFTDASPTGSGIVGAKLYIPGTTPANSVIYDTTTDTDDVTVTLLAEGGSIFYSPTVTITTVPAQSGGPIVALLTENPTDRRTFFATADLIGITVNTVVTATSSTGATAVLTIQRAGAGPTFTVLNIGPLPGVQTEAKAGDTVTVTGRVENSATYAELLADGASGTVSVLTLGIADSFGAGFKAVTGTFVVSSLSGAQSVTAQAHNALGTFGAPWTSSNMIVLNQTYPTIGARSIVYPGTQLGLKASESAMVLTTITDFDTVAYSGTNLLITLPTTYAIAKTVTRTGGSYSFGTNNYTITANKASNNATSVASSPISIADVAPTAAISIVGNPSRLFSSLTGTDYTITITANQQLLSAPSLSASAGVWQGGGWAGSGTTWTRVLRILDVTPKGPHTFSNLSVTGLAGLIGNTITAGDNYFIGGFATRRITFPPFARFAAIGTTVVDFSKVTASYAESNVLARRADTTIAFQSFTIVDAAGDHDPLGGYLFISDAAFAGANTTGTLQLDVSEAA